MSIEIPRHNGKNGDEHIAQPNKTGEPLSVLADGDFEMYKAALERLGVPTAQAQNCAENARSLYSQPDAVRSRREAIRDGLCRVFPRISFVNTKREDDAKSVALNDIPNPVEYGIIGALIASGLREPVPATITPREIVVFKRY